MFKFGGGGGGGFVCFLARPLCTSVDSHNVSVSVSHCDTGSHVELEIFLGYKSSESMQHGGFNPIISSFLVTWSNLMRRLADQILNTGQFYPLSPNFLVFQTMS